MSAPTPASRRPSYVNYTAARTLRALEALAFAQGTAPELARALRTDARTARRMLGTLVSEHYVERVPNVRGARYVPTVRLLSLAAQLARHLPVVRCGEHSVAELHEATGLTAYLAAPAYVDVLVLARAGSTRPWAWQLLPAPRCAPGQVLLAHREPWRHSLGPNGELEQLAQDVVHRGHAVVADGETDAVSLAVPVPQAGVPVTALALTGPAAMSKREGDLVQRLSTAAAQLAQRCIAETRSPREVLA